MIIGDKGLVKEEPLIEINGRKYTNKFYHPPEIIACILKNRYLQEDEAPSDFSATKLIAPIQMTILTNRYKDNLKIKDVSDFSWAMFGSLAHSAIEEASRRTLEGGLTEVRLYATLLGKTISGKMDRYIDGEIKDWKFTKVYKWKKKDFTEWEQQMAVLTYLLRVNGYPVNKISITMHLRDFTANDSYKKGYPDCEWQVIDIPVWSQEKCESYIVERLNRLEQSASLSDKALADFYPCSDKECWQDIKDWSILKIGAKSATKCFDNEEDCRSYFQEKQMDFDKYVIVKRMTERKRCLKWCDVSHVCSQFQTYLKEKKGAE